MAGLDKLFGWLGRRATQAERAATHTEPHLATSSPARREADLQQPATPLAARAADAVADLATNPQFKSNQALIEKAVAEIKRGGSKNTYGPEAFQKLENALSENGLLISKGASQQAAQVKGPLDRFKGWAGDLVTGKNTPLGIVKEIEAGRPITWEQFTILKGANPKMGVLAEAPSGVSAQALRLLATPYNYLREPLNYAGAASRQFLTRAGIVAGGLFVADHQLNADRQGMGVTSRTVQGIIQTPLDAVLDSDLEKYTGNSSTPWESDREFDRLVKDGGLKSKIFSKRVEQVLGANGGKTLEELKKVASGTPEYWKVAFDLATQLQSAGGGKLDPAMMYAFKHAVARNLGMEKPAQGEITPESIKQFCEDSYISTTVAMMTSPRPTAESRSLRDTTFRSFLRTDTLPDNQNLNDVLLGAIARDLSTTEDPFGRRIVERYLETTLKLDAGSLSPTKANEILKAREEQKAAAGRNEVTQTMTTALANRVAGRPPQEGETAPLAQQQPLAPRVIPTTLAQVVKDINDMLSTPLTETQKAAITTGWGRAVPDGKADTALELNAAKAEISKIPDKDLPATIKRTAVGVLDMSLNP